MRLPGLEQLALVPTASRIPKDKKWAYYAFDKIFRQEQPSTAEAARIPARGDWDAVPESERWAYRMMSSSVHFLNPPTELLNQIDEGLRQHDATLPPMLRLFLEEWLQGYFVDTHHHLHSTQHSRVHAEAYVTFWNDYLVPLAGAAPIQAVSGTQVDDFIRLRDAIGALKPHSAQ